MIIRELNNFKGLIQKLFLSKKLPHQTKICGVSEPQTKCKSQRYHKNGEGRKEAANA